jgi:hypothetical protein
MPVGSLKPQAMHSLDSLLVMLQAQLARPIAAMMGLVVRYQSVSDALPSQQGTHSRQDRRCVQLLNT